MGNDYSRFHLVQFDSRTTLLFDRESIQIFPLDVEEDAELLAILGKREYSESDCQELDELVQQIADGPQSCEVNNFTGEKAQYSSLILPIASSCNLACPYCFAQTSSSEFAFEDYTEADIDRLLSFLDAHNQDIPTTLIFFGGEPLIQMPIIEYTVAKVKQEYPHLQIGYSITTNGTLLNRRIAQFLKAHSFAILLSMDGYDNEFNYRRFRNGRPSVARVLRSIELLKEENIPFEIRATVTSDNPYLYETHHFFEGLEVPYQIAFAYSSGNKAHEELNTFSEETICTIRAVYERLLAEYRESFRKGLPVYNNLVGKFVKQYEMRSRTHVACSAGFNYFTIMANGDIHYCAHLMNQPAYRLGNLYSRELPSDYSHLSHTPKPITDLEDCRSCWARHLCAGGCASQKISEGRRANQSYSPCHCELERLQYEFYMKCYYLRKAYGREEINEPGALAS